MGLKQIAYGAGITIVTAGVILGVTNPPPEDYVEFAVQEGVEYLQEEACTQELPFVGTSFQDECTKFVQSESAQQRLRKAIIEKTQRQNYILFSLYRSELEVRDLLPFSIPGTSLPAYSVHTVGFLKTFRIYDTEEQEQ